HQIAQSDFDVTIIMDDSCPINPDAVNLLPGLKCYYMVDTHLHLHCQKLIGSVFDVVFVAQKADLDEVRRFNQNALWLPLFASIVSVPERKHDRCVFVGNLDRPCHEERKQFLEKLSKIVPLEIIKAPWYELYPTVSIVVNKSIKNDLNFRVFEALSSKCLLITDKTVGLNDLFVDRCDLVVYDNLNECAELVEYFLAYPTEAKQIAESGHKKFLEHHTEEKRALQMLEYLKNKKERRVNDRERALARLGYILWLFKIASANGQLEAANALLKQSAAVLTDFNISWHDLGLT
ncbi:MAG: glycosyltransferase, partial [Deltaproteobacteria bacterium]|nr:glycosyltransferase [Deltaproteobacteria bacterium]